MTTLAANVNQTYELGDRNEFPVIAADIIYEGAAVGLVDASGHAQPLTSSDRFVGFAEEKVDNSAGAAAAKNVRVVKKGCIKLAITGAVITDVGQPVYATDDAAFTFVPTGGVFIGFMRRFVSSGYGIVEFDAGVLRDPHEGFTAETVADNLTVDAQDVSKVLCVTTDAKPSPCPPWKAWPSCGCSTWAPSEPWPSPSAPTPTTWWNPSMQRALTTRISSTPKPPPAVGTTSTSNMAMPTAGASPQWSAPGPKKPKRRS